MKYRWIERLRGQYPMALMCRVLGVSVQGYHQWQGRAPARARRAVQEQAVRDKLCAAHAESHPTYGRIRLRRELKAQGTVVNEKRGRRYMKLDGLRAKAARKFKATTDSDHRKPVAPNTLQRDFTATAPNQKWVGDITYIWTEEGWLYLAVVIDLYSRMVVGWSLGERMVTELVCSALRMAVNRRKLPQ